MAISIAKIPNSIFREYSNKNAEMLEEAILNGILLPDDATNGDVIKALFPKGKEINLVYSLEYRIDDEVTLLGILNWWNAPYKGGKE